MAEAPEECHICREVLGTEGFPVCEASHQMHLSCIHQWRRLGPAVSSNTCPVCRRPLVELPPQPPTTPPLSSNEVCPICERATSSTDVPVCEAGHTMHLGCVIVWTEMGFEWEGQCPWIACGARPLPLPDVNNLDQHEQQLLDQQLEPEADVGDFGAVGALQQAPASPSDISLAPSPPPLIIDEESGMVSLDVIEVQNRYNRRHHLPPTQHFPGRILGPIAGDVGFDPHIQDYLPDLATYSRGIEDMGWEPNRHELESYRVNGGVNPHFSGNELPYDDSGELPPFLTPFFRPSVLACNYANLLSFLWDGHEHTELRLRPVNVFTVRVLDAEIALYADTENPRGDRMHVERYAAGRQGTRMRHSTLGSIAARRVDVRDFFDGDTQIDLATDEYYCVTGMVFFTCNRCENYISNRLVFVVSHQNSHCTGEGGYTAGILEINGDINDVFFPMADMSLDSPNMIHFLDFNMYLLWVREVLRWVMHNETGYYVDSDELLFIHRRRVIRGAATKARHLLTMTDTPTSLLNWPTSLRFPPPVGDEYTHNPIDLEYSRRRDICQRVIDNNFLFEENYNSLLSMFDINAVADEYHMPTL